MLGWKQGSERAEQMGEHVLFLKVVTATHPWTDVASRKCRPNKAIISWLLRETQIKILL